MDVGRLLLRELGLRAELFRQLSTCLRNGGDPKWLQHSVEVFVAARAQCGAICLKLLKLGVRMQIGVRGVRLDRPNERQRR